MQYFSWSFKNFLDFASTLRHIPLNMVSKVKKNSVYSVWNNVLCFFQKWSFSQRWNSTLKMTTLFRRWIMFFISTLKYKTLIRLCSTLQIPILNHTTLFQLWFDVVPRRDVVLTKRQRWNNVEIFAGIDVWQDPKHAFVKHQPNKMIKRTQKIRRLN